MAPGLHGQLGAAAAGPVVLEEPQDIVSAWLPRLLGGNPVREGAKITKIYLRNAFADNFRKQVYTFC